MGDSLQGSICSSTRWRMSKLRTVARVLDLKDWKKEEIENEVKHLRAQINKLEAQLILSKNIHRYDNEFEEKQRSCEMDVHRLAFSSYFMGSVRRWTHEKRDYAQALRVHERQDALIAAYKTRNSSRS